MESVKILENWTEIEAIEAKAREHTGDPEAGFNADALWLGGNGRHLNIPIQYRTKKGKNSDFSKKYKEIVVLAKFCPFTGKPLYTDLLPDQLSDAEKIILDSLKKN